MIKLTRLGGEPFILNAELIRYVEARPDTFITLTTGERIVVQEGMDEVLRRAVDYQRSKYLVPPPAPRPGAAVPRPPQTGTQRGEGPEQKEQTEQREQTTRAEQAERAGR